MDQDFEKDFAFDVLFENDSISNYLVLRAKDCSSILNYQVQMLLNNNINGLLKFNINYVGNGLNCFYNVTSKCSLANFMSRKKFSRNEFLIMALNIINNICRIKNYLLHDCNILLDERYIFVEPERIELYFVYLPFSGIKNDYKTFFIKLIVDMANFYREDSDNYLQRLLEVIKSDLFNLSILKAQLEILLKIDIKNQVQALENYTDDTADPVREKRMGRKADKKINEKTDKKSRTAAQARNIKIPLSNEENNNTENYKPGIIQKKDIEKTIKEETGKKVNTGFILLQPILLIAYIFAITSGFIDTGEGKSITAIIGFVILASVDILVFRLIRERNGNTFKGNGTEVISFIADKMRAGVFSEKEYPGKEAIPRAETDTVSKQESSKDKIPEPQGVYIGETEIIRKPGINAGAYLKETQGEAVIEFDKSSILVGRMEGLVDAVVNSSAVGKIHAEILSEEGIYYLVDCNSRNGTFVNDKRLVPNTRNKILNNDLVRFANKEYQFFASAKPLEEAI